ncbi:MAG: ABC transporter permease subunit [Anaerolineae bacterium]|nr:ABC transporter permease subunit [Anaerolineae bacterium]
MLTMRDGGAVFRNTILIAVGKIVSGQVASVAFALLLHQVSNSYFRRAVQTVTTFPHFLSWVVVGGIILRVLSSTGLVNSALGYLGLQPVRFLTDPRLFPLTLIGTETWKEFGFGSVIYLAALTAINPELYEAAAVDGAGRWARLWAVTVPGITPTIVLMSCLNLGNILNAGFEQILILQNPLVYSTGDVIDTFVYRAGVLEAQYSLATALGLLRSTLGLVLILTSYWLADRLADYRIF